MMSNLYTNETTAQPDAVLPAIIYRTFKGELWYG